MKKTLLVIGDLTQDGSYRAPNINLFLREFDESTYHGMSLRIVTYYDLLAGDLPEINNQSIIVLFFFPYRYWNDNIETYNKNGRIYGDEYFGREFKKLFNLAERKLQEKYSRLQLKFINSPESCFLNRDKGLTSRILASKGILVPKMHHIHNLSHLNSLLEKGLSFYVKPRFGAMGKGITYLDKDACHTNFMFKASRIISKHYDYNWHFHKVTQRDSFLKKLLGKDVVWEEAVSVPIIRGRRFDLRIYVIFDKIPYLYAKSASQNQFVTNWSQGGRIEKSPFIKKWIPRKKLKEAKDIAREAAKAIGLNYAGIDIIFSDGFKQVYALEAHSFPAYEKGFNLMRFLLKRMQQEKY